MFKSHWIAGIVLLIVTVSSSNGHPIYLYNTTFDGDTVGQIPSGWTVTFGAVNLANTSVQTHGTAPTPSKVLQVGGTGEAFELGVTYSPDQDLNAGAKLAYQFDINVDFINGNDGEGFLSRLYDATASRIDTGYPRVLRNGALWRFYNGNSGANASPPYTPAGAGGFNFDQWYTLRVELVASSSTSGQAFWYLGDSALDLQTLADDLILTETYSGKIAGGGSNQTQNIARFDFANVGLNGTGFRMYVDNLTIVTPEPASLATLGFACTALLGRRRRASRA